MKVSICIPTFRRAEDLRRLLASLHALKFNAVPEPSIEIVVVENGSEASAAEVCRSFDGLRGWPLIYDIEPLVGVSRTRNRAIRNVSDADFIAMIDDDEIADPAWLDTLLATQARFEADVVTGPVFPLFERLAESQRWIEKGGFFAPPTHATGALLDKGFTGNILVRSCVLQGLECPFDDRFDLKGAEDTHLFMKLRRAGHKIVWAAEAVAHERVAESRTNLRWILARNFWGWSSHAFLERETGSSLAARALRLAKGLLLVVAGAIGLLPALFAGRHRFYQALVQATRGLGTLSGALGFQGHWPR